MHNDMPRYNIGDLVAIESHYIFNKDKPPEYILITDIDERRYYYLSLTYGSDSSDITWIIDTQLRTKKVA
jgi:hypothetical protein